nr:glycoside hydrolase family 26 protein [Lachnospiraceae bacterium]
LEGKIVTLSFHWYSPLGGRDKSFYAENTDFDPSKVLVEGTPERNAFYEDMEKIAVVLQEFKEYKIPVLWRPFHESDGTWFWWGSKGPEVAKELYKLMFDYYVNVKSLDNLLWVWNCRLKSGYPGDDYVDIISLDEYLPEYKPTDYKEQYDKLIFETTQNKVAALAELGYLPSAEMLSQSKVPWVYFMTWSKEFIIGEQYNTVENLKKVYENPYVISDKEK